MEKNSFTSGKILSPLLRFAFPVLLALLLQAMYGAVDLLVVGKFGHTADISGVSTGSQLMQMVTFAVTSLAMGLTVLIGQRIGEGRPQEAGKIVGSGLVLFAAVGAGLTAVLLALAVPLARLMQAPAEAFGETVGYLRICAAGTVFIVAFNVLGSIFRGVGDSKMPLITVGIACVVNIAGDLLCVAVLHMGAAGAAVATVAAQAVSVVISTLVIARRKLPLTMTRQDVRFDGGRIGAILRIGVPLALQDFLVSVSFAVILAIVNGLGLTYSAGMGVAEKICAFIMLVPSAYMQSMSSFVAQNIGADKPERARLALRYGILTSVVASLLLFYVSFFHGAFLAQIFANEQAVILAAADYLRAYAIDCILTCFLFCLIGYFSGLGRTTFVMIQGIAGAFLVRIPVSFFMSRQPDASLFRIGLATPMSTVLQILLCFAYLCLLHRAERKEHRL